MEQLKQYIRQLRTDDVNYRGIKKKISVPIGKHPGKFLYYYQVWKYTNMNMEKVNNVHLRSQEYHLDHIIPICIGYKYNLCPYVIGDHRNLRIIPSKENINKAGNILS